MIIWNKSITYLMCFVFLFGALSLAYAQTEEEVDIIGKDAADFTLPLLLSDGETVTLSSFEGNKAVIIDFFATWCGPCRKNIPLLDEFYEKYKDKVEVFTIDMEDDVEMLEEYFTDEENAVSFGILHDPEAKTKKDYPFQFIPYMVIINKKGVVVDTHTGYDPDLIKYLEGILGLGE